MRKTLKERRKMMKKIKCITKEALKNCKCEECKEFRKVNGLLLMDYVQTQLLNTFIECLPPTKKKK